jgi:hypothetical protein
MTTTATADDWSPKAYRRAQAILDAIRQVTGKEKTMMELAVLVDRTPGHSFGRDLALARHMALDADERITECYWSKARGCQVLVHLMPDAENQLGIWGLLPHGQRVTTYASTLKRHGAWERKHAQVKSDRDLARVAERMGAATAELGHLFQDLRDVLKDLDRNGKGNGNGRGS